MCSGVVIPEKKSKDKGSKKLKRKSSDPDASQVKQIKTEEVTSQLVSLYTHGQISRVRLPPSAINTN